LWQKESCLDAYQEQQMMQGQKTLRTAVKRAQGCFMAKQTAQTDNIATPTKPPWR
jgi:hypothetical protein